MEAECELRITCVFLTDKMAHMPVTAELMKQQYCTGDFSKCARYRVFKALGRERVPADLLPFAVDRCDAILNRR